MNTLLSGGAACAALALLFAPSMAVADDAVCPVRPTPADAVRCALATNPEVRRVRGEWAVLAARRITAGVVLPSFPQLDVIVAARSAPGDSAFNTYLTLRQELEVGGQKQARLDEVDAEAAAQVRRVAVAENEAAAQALTAYFDLVAAGQRQQQGALLAGIAEILTAYVRARVGSELLSAVDGHVVEAEVAHLRAAVFEAERGLALAHARFQAIGGDAVPDGMAPAAGSEPLAIPIAGLPELVARALTIRGEIAAAEQETKVFAARAALFDRLGTPNVSLLLTAQRDGFQENVFGAGLAIPIAFPSSLGPSRVGEAREARAEGERAKVQVEVVRRRVRLEVERAFVDWRSRVAEAALFAPALVEAVRQDLRALSAQIAAGRLPIREAIHTQEALLGLLEHDLEARRALALAAVELTRAAGLAWPGATR